MQRFIVWMSALFAVLVVGFGEAHAGESSRLAYLLGDGTGHCPNEKALRVAVAVRLGYDPFVAWAKTTVHAQLGRDGSNLRARVYLADENGHVRGSRELSAPLDECENLVAAVALAISIAIDPLSASVPSPPPNRVSNIEEDPQPALAERASVPASAPASNEGREGAGSDRKDAGVARTSQRASIPSAMQWYAGMGTHLASGTAPDLAAGLTAFARLELVGVSLGLEGRYDFPASADAPSGVGVVSSMLLLASLEPCVRVSPLYFCGLLSVGSLRGWGAGVADPSEDSTVYWGGGGRVALELDIFGPILLRAHADVVGNGTRTRLEIGEREAWRAPPFAAALGINLVAHVW